jgi:hypothetical protein
LTISRLRAALVITFAVLSLMAGAQAAQACTEPALGDIQPRGEEHALIPFELTGLTPGSDYLLKVNGRERKSGTAPADTVKRRFRLPHMGDSKRRVTVEVVIANDTCENGPWKLKQKMTYTPAPEPVPVTPTPTPAPSPTPAPQANPTPSPPPAPSPPAAPSITKPAPKSQPPVPPPAVAPSIPKPLAEPPRDGKAWMSALDPYQKLENDPPKLNPAQLARTEQPSDPANSTAALVGLGGIFLLLCGIGAIGWTKFRRYDDERLAVILNPDGKLPESLAGLDDEEKARVKRARKRGRRKAPLPTFDPTASGADAAAAASAPGRTPAAAAAAEKHASAGAGDEAQPKEQAKRLRRRLRRKAPLPASDPTASGAETVAAAAAGNSGKDKQASEDGSDEARAKERRKKARRRLRRKAPLPTFDPTAPPVPEVSNGKPPPAAVPPSAAPHANGTENVTAPDERPLNRHSYRKQVESELQRILEEAGLHTEVDGILADARAEAERQGVAIDSEAILKALSEEANGSPKLSDSAKEELESRFKRIVAEERGESRSPGS